METPKMRHTSSSSTENKGWNKMQFSIFQVEEQEGEGEDI